MTRAALGALSGAGRDQQLNRGQRRERPTARARPRHVEAAGDWPGVATARRCFSAAGGRGNDGPPRGDRRHRCAGRGWGWRDGPGARHSCATTLARSGTDLVVAAMLVLGDGDGHRVGVVTIVGAPRRRRSSACGTGVGCVNAERAWSINHGGRRLYLRWCIWDGLSIDKPLMQRCWSAGVRGW